MVDRKEELKIWDILNQLDLQSMIAEKKYLVEQEKSWRGVRAKSADEKAIRANIKEQKKNLNVTIKNLKAERKILNEAYLTSFHLETNFRKVYKKEYEKRKTHDKDVRKEIEAILRKHGIDRAAHHGGELTGPFLRKLSENAEKIFQDLKQCLLEAIEGDAQGDATHQASADEICTMCDKCAELYILFDGLFALSRTPSFKFTPEIDNQMVKYIRVCMKAWRCMGFTMGMPKIHAIEDHLLEEMRYWMGIGCFCEDFIEQAHQFGNIAEKRTHGMRDFVKKFVSQSRNEKIQQLPDVINAKTKVEEDSPKKKRKNSAREDNETEKRQRRERYLESAFEKIGRGEFMDITDYESLKSNEPADGGN